MGQYTKHETLEPFKFNDQTITVVVKRIGRKDFKKVLGRMQKINALNTEVAEKVGVPATIEVEGKKVPNPVFSAEVEKDPRFMDEIMEVIDEIAPRLKDYVVSIDGPKDKDGAIVPLECIVEEACWMKLLTHIVLGITNTANLGEEEQGNSAQPSAA